MRARTLMAALCVVVFAAGCSQTLDTGDLEGQIATLLADGGGPEVTEVTCPPGIEVEPGASFTCTASGAGAIWTVRVTQRDDAGSVDIEIVDTA